MAGGEGESEDRRKSRVETRGAGGAGEGGGGRGGGGDTHHAEIADVAVSAAPGYRRVLLLRRVLRNGRPNGATLPLLLAPPPASAICKPTARQLWPPSTGAWGLQTAGLAVALLGDGGWTDQADGAMCAAARTTATTTAATTTAAASTTPPSMSLSLSLRLTLVLKPAASSTVRFRVSAAPSVVAAAGVSSTSSGGGSTVEVAVAAGGRVSELRDAILRAAPGRESGGKGVGVGSGGRE